MNIPLAARFRAIITGPLNGVPNASDCRQESYGGPRLHDSAGTKRKKDQDDVGPSNPKVLRRAVEAGTSTREPTVSYRSQEELLKALQDRFKQGPHVDFHGVYEITDPDSTHKARIQNMANEIWKATGYRFTVKDHPHFINGHKTRFWCSQDEAHRSKSSRAARRAQGDLYKPRQSSSGESLAKNRFPCRSRLLISSRDSNTPGRLNVTVRMHHHIAHEPYVDLSLPPDVAQGVLDGYWWMGREAPEASKGANGIVDPPLPIAIQQTSNQPMVEDQTPPEEDTYHDIPPELPQEIPAAIRPPPTVVPQSHEHHPHPHPPSPLQSPPSIPQNMSQPLPLPTANIYHRRMSAHIRNLREFCDGLEYQLQFNDYRMLDVLEREGGPFLELVADCLRKEGRLIAADQSLVTPSPVHATTSQMINNVAHDYEGNPGINPSALGC